MTDEVMVDRALADWLTSSPAPALRERVVLDAFNAAHKTRQRGRVELALLGPSTWPSGGLAVPGLGRMRWMPVLPAARQVSLIVVIVLLLAMLVVALAGGIRQPRPTWPPFGSNGVIAYTVGPFDDRPLDTLHVIAPDGSNHRELAQASSATFSIDGSVLFYRDQSRVVRTDPDGRYARSFDLSNRATFAVSPNGKEIALVARRGPVSVLNIADGTLRELLPALAAGKGYSDVRWSPDGSLIAVSLLQELTMEDNLFAYREAIGIVDVATGAQRVLTRRSGSLGGMAWAPSSEMLAFTGVGDRVPRPAFGPAGDTETLYPTENIFLIRADGTGEVELPGAPRVGIDLEWASDGHAIAYITYEEESQDVRLFVQKLSGSRPAGDPLPGPFGGEATWSPDSQHLIFVVNRDGDTLAGLDAEYFIAVVDGNLEQQPEILVSHGAPIGSISWQRLDP